MNGQPGTGTGSKPNPTGLFCLLPGDEPPDISEHDCLQLDIDGFRVRMGWKDIQPATNRDEVTEALDETLEIARLNDKSIGLNVAGNIMQPEWAYTVPGTDVRIFKYDYLETDKQTGLSVGSTPLIWDPAYQKLAEDFIHWFGKQYDGNPALSYLMANFFMQICPMYYCNTQEDIDAMDNLARNPPTGFGELSTVTYNGLKDAYVPAAKWFIDLWMKSFPRTPVMVTICPPWPTEDGQDAQNEVKQYGLDTYPGRFGTFVAARYAEAGTQPAERVDFPKGSQFAYNAQNQNHKQWKKPVPDPIPANPATFVATIDAAVSKADKFVECYEVDLVENEAAVLAEQRAKLKAMA